LVQLNEQLMDTVLRKSLAGYHKQQTRSTKQIWQLRHILIAPKSTIEKINQLLIIELVRYIHYFISENTL